MVDSSPKMTGEVFQETWVVNDPGLGKPQMVGSLAPGLRGLLQGVVGNCRVAQQEVEWEQMVLGLCCSFLERD